MTVFDRVTKRDKQAHFPCADSLSNLMEGLRPGQPAEPELSLRLMSGQLPEPSHCLPRKLELGAEEGLQPRCSAMRYRCRKQVHPTWISCAVCGTQDSRQ